MNKSFAFLIFSVVGLLPASAQQSAAPQPPYLQAPDAGSRWSVQITPLAPSSDHKDDTPGNETPSRSAVVWEMTFGTNRLGKGVIKYSDGTQQEYYTALGSILQKCANSDHVALWQPEQRMGSEELRVAAFPALDWIDSKYYSGTESIKGRNYYKFQTKSDFVAWIDINTRYPFKVQKLGKLYTYSTVQQFSNDVEMPPGYILTLKKFKTEIAVAEVLKHINSAEH